MRKKWEDPTMTQSLEERSKTASSSTLKVYCLEERLYLDKIKQKEVWRGKIKFRMLKMCVNGYFRDGRRSPWTPGNALR